MEETNLVKFLENINRGLGGGTRQLHQFIFKYNIAIARWL